MSTFPAACSSDYQCRTLYSISFIETSSALLFSLTRLIPPRLFSSRRANLGGRYRLHRPSSSSVHRVRVGLAPWKPCNVISSVADDRSHSCPPGSRIAFRYEFAVYEAPVLQMWTVNRLLRHCVSVGSALSQNSKPVFIIVLMEYNKKSAELQLHRVVVVQESQCCYVPSGIDTCDRPHSECL